MGARADVRGPLPGQEGDWSRTVVLCSGTWWDAAPMPDQHMARALAEHTSVLYVDPPLSPLTSLRHPDLRGLSREPRLRMVGPRIARLTPAAPPGKGRPGIRHLTAALTRRQMRGAARRLGADVHATVVASLEPLFGVFGESRRVLYGTDDFVAGAELLGIDVPRLERREAEQLRDATTVVAISDNLAAKWRAMGTRPIVIPNGVDTDNYVDSDLATLPGDVTLPAPVAGFVGHLSHRIDFQLLTAVARTGASLLIVGPKQLTFAPQELDDLLALPNVQWVGGKAFDQLPGYLKVMDVGLVPYAHSAFNEASFPLKALEYLAAGRAAVSSDLPYLQWLDTDLIASAHEPDDFAAAVTAALAQPRTDADVAARQAFAALHDWRQRGATLAGELGLTGEHVGHSPAGTTRELR